MNRIALKIREARIKAGLNEKQLAKKCGLSVGYIIQIESGKKIVKEELADKILTSLGEKVAELDDGDNNITTPKEETAKPKIEIVEHTNVVTPNSQWAHALSGVIKKYPVYDCQGTKIVEYKELPIVGKKIEGHHPDKIMFLLAPSDELISKRIKRRDILTLSITKEIENNAPYIYEIEKTRYIGLLKKEGNKQIGILNPDTGEVSKKIDQKSVKIIGKCIRVEFRI